MRDDLSRGRSWIVRGATLLAALTLVATACGGDDGGSGEGTGAEGGGDVDPDGVLRIPYNLQGAPPNFDPANQRPPSPATSIQLMVYDTLLRPTGDNGELEPGLAKAVDYVDPTTVKIALQEGVTFTDGTPFDAEAVKAGIEYSRDSESMVLTAERKSIEEIVVDGPLELTLHLSEPVAGEIVNMMAYGDFLIPSPKALADGVDLETNPVGAGPFELEDYEQGEKITLVKNEDYFQADDIRLAGVEWVNVAPGESLVNALRSGAVDVGEMVPHQTATQLEGTGVEVELDIGDNVMMWGQVCKSRPPFDDVRVRQALNHGLDRDALNDAVFGGEGAPMWGFWTDDGELYDPALEDYFEYDPERARDLLAEAGQEDLSFDMFFSPGVSDRAAEVVQAQWSEIGVTANLKPLTNTQDFFPDAQGAPMFFFPLERDGIQKVARNLVPGSVGNVCNWNDPELTAAVGDVRAAETGSDEAAEAWQRVQERAMETAASIFGVFGVRARVWNPDRVGDPSFMPNFQGRPTVNFYEAYIKQ
ncbi:MAG TPA: ABC transporter substrate-binding protein [Acidimicrobiales bacterium]|nr:ABC transporter substrate-binding protein [Acidimicrobiales bacterium]